MIHSRTTVNLSVWKSLFFLQITSLLFTYQKSVLMFWCDKDAHVNIQRKDYQLADPCCYVLL